jgi:hypothetical protein
MSQFSTKSKQREKIVAQFVTFTQANEKSATLFLNNHDWKLDLAVDAYFLSLDSSRAGGGGGGGGRNNNSNTNNSTSIDRKKLDALWNNYKSKNN